MSSFYVTVGKVLPLMIIPDNLEHVDVHPVLADRYSIYHDGKTGGKVEHRSTRDLPRERKNDPDYMGTIVYEIPGRSLNYIADGKEHLSPFEIQELVNKIDEYRETPHLWSKE